MKQGTQETKESKRVTFDEETILKDQSPEREIWATGKKNYLHRGDEITKINEYILEKNYTKVEELVKNPSRGYSYDVTRRNILFYEAIKLGDTEAVDIFIKKGFKLDMKFDGLASNRVNFTPLILAVNLENENMVKYLLEKGASPNFQTAKTSPVFQAVKKGNLSILKTLHEAGASFANDLSRDIKEADKFLVGESIRNVDKKVFDYLIENGAPLVSRKGVNALKIAQDLDLDEYSEAIINKQTKPKATFELTHANFELIAQALGEDNPEVLNNLITSGMSPSFEIDNVSLLEAAYMNDASKMFNTLLEAGAKPDVVYDKDTNNSLIHQAAEDQKLNYVKALLDHGADITPQSTAESFKLSDKIDITTKSIELKNEIKSMEKAGLSRKLLKQNNRINPSVFINSKQATQIEPVSPQASRSINQDTRENSR